MTARVITFKSFFLITLGIASSQFHISNRASMECSSRRMDLYACDWPAALRKARVVAPNNGSPCFLLPYRMGAVYQAVRPLHVIFQNNPLPNY